MVDWETLMKETPCYQEWYTELGKVPSYEQFFYTNTDRWDDYILKWGKYQICISTEINAITKIILISHFTQSTFIMYFNTLLSIIIDFILCICVYMYTHWQMHFSLFSFSCPFFLTLVIVNLCHLCFISYWGSELYHVFFWKMENVNKLQIMKTDFHFLG